MGCWRLCLVEYGSDWQMDQSENFEFEVSYQIRVDLVWNKLYDKGERSAYHHRRPRAIQLVGVSGSLRLSQTVVCAHMFCVTTPVALDCTQRGVVGKVHCNSHMLGGPANFCCHKPF